MGTIEKLRYIRFCNVSDSSFCRATKLLERIEKGASEKIAKSFLTNWELEYPQCVTY